MAERVPERNRAGGGRLENVSGALLVRRFSVRQPEMYRVIESVLARKLTTIDKAALCELAQTAMDIEYDALEGDFIDFGRGSTGAAVVLESAKRRSRTLVALDKVDVDTDGPIALAHLDCGEYEPMSALLERLAPRLAPGGRFILNAYKARPECRLAVDDYFRGKGGFQFVRKSRLHVIKH